MLFITTLHALQCLAYLFKVGSHIPRRYVYIYYLNKKYSFGVYNISELSHLFPIFRKFYFFRFPVDGKHFMKIVNVFRILQNFSLSTRKYFLYCTLCRLSAPNNWKFYTKIIKFTSSVCLIDFFVIKRIILITYLSKNGMTEWTVHLDFAS